MYLFEVFSSLKNFGGLDYLVTGSVLVVHGLYDTHNDGLSHITDSETSQRSELLEGLNALWLGWDQVDNSGIARFDRFRVAIQH